jgi:hypothetical protein
MPSPRSVPRHWPFQHCFQSLFVLVFHVVWNRTKIESGSFPMSLFLWSTIWCSLIILSMSWPTAAAALNSWPSWLWSHNSSPPLFPEPHCAMLENQVIWLYDLGFCFWALDGLRRKIVFFGLTIPGSPKAHVLRYLISERTFFEMWKHVFSYFNFQNMNAIRKHMPWNLSKKSGGNETQNQMRE